jgi:hypothetical protein
MSAPAIDQIISSATASLAAWNSFIDEILEITGPSNEAFDLEKPIPTLTLPISTFQFSEKLNGVVELIISLASLDSVSLLPDVTLNDLITSSSSLKIAIDEGRGTVTKQLAETKIISVDVQNMSAATEAGPAINLPPILVRIYAALQTTLMAVRQIIAMSAANSPGKTDEYIGELTASRATLRKALSEVGRLRKAAEITRGNLGQMLDSANKTLSEINGDQKISASTKVDLEKSLATAKEDIARVLTATKADVTQVTDTAKVDFAQVLTSLKTESQQIISGAKSEHDQNLAAMKTGSEQALAVLKTNTDQTLATLKSGSDQVLKEATSSVTAINTHLGDASRVRDSALALQPTIDKFSTELAERNASFVHGKQEFDELQQRITTAEGELSRLKDRAREVLGEATVSGLSDRFERESRKLGTRMIVSQALFFIGIIAFLLSAGVVIDVFPWLTENGFIAYNPVLPPNSPDLGPALVYLFGNVIGKIIFLLPSAILIAFAARWYATLFKLRAQYAYKYTVAASLPGFKTEAPIYAEAIVASAFKELLYNPAEQPVNAEESPVGNSFLQRLIEPIIKKHFDQAMASIETKKAD